MIAKRLPECFLLVAAILLLAGVAIGLWMGATHNHLLRPVHAHANLIGWASMALFGLTYRSYRADMRHAGARRHFYVASAAAVCLPLGMWVDIAAGDTRLVAAASLLWLVACLQYFAFVLHLARGLSADA